MRPGEGALAHASNLTVSESLWQDSRKDILRALHHPFIRQLGDGSLPRHALPLLFWKGHPDA